MSKLGSLIGLVKHAIWAYSLYFLQCNIAYFLVISHRISLVSGDHIAVVTDKYCPVIEVNSF
jgi:hypothetical protein